MMSRETYRTLLPACRAFVRLHAIRCQPIEEGQRADYAFDCGEFSGPYFDDCYEQVWDRTADAIATKFGVDRLLLSNAVNRYMHADMAHIAGYTDNN